MHQRVKFRVDCFTVAEIWPFFDFSWIFKSSKFYLPVRFGRSICFSMPNFVPFAEIWPIFYSFFKMAAARHLGFVLRVFGPLTKSICWSLSLCKISLESVAVVSIICQF